MASQESVDQLTQLMAQMQQTMLTVQNNIVQLQNQQNQPPPNVNLPIDPQFDPLNDPPVDPLPPANPHPNIVLPQNQPNPMQDKLEKIESALRKTGKIDGYLFNLKSMCPHPDVRLPENFKFPDMDKFDGTGNPVVHLRMFVGTLQPMGLEPKNVLQPFSPYPYWSRCSVVSISRRLQN